MSAPGAAPRSIEGDGVVVVAAHPDDETVGAGGILPHLPGCFLVHLTDGAPRDPGLRGEGFDGARGGGRRQATRSPECPPDDRAAYAGARREELSRALALAGVRRGRAVGLGAIDQEAPMEIARLAREVEAALEERLAAVVITHPYEGGHPDHDAAAVIVRAAVERLRRRRGRAPAIVEMTSYHAGERGLVTGAFLRGAEEVITVRLGAADAERKRRMLACFATQRRVLAAFEVGVERFRLAPRYDFGRAPHEGPLHYERLGWPMSGARFRELAGEALRALGLGAGAPWA
ncbi:MAG: PIG-L family deacetylase [Polyangiaceae bacterium]|nr:PIG-L family deacetylase [Polyangiaceae bacterium]